MHKTGHSDAGARLANVGAPGRLRLTIVCTTAGTMRKLYRRGSRLGGRPAAIGRPRPHPKASYPPRRRRCSLSTCASSELRTHRDRRGRRERGGCCSHLPPHYHLLAARSVGEGTPTGPRLASPHHVRAGSGFHQVEVVSACARGRWAKRLALDAEVALQDRDGEITGWRAAEDWRPRVRFAPA